MDTLWTEHWSSEAHFEELERRGCLVLYEVDVYEMHQHPTLMCMKFDIIIFNYAGHYSWLCERDDELIQMHRDLLKAFFKSARGMLSQGGEVHVSHRDDYPYDQWKLKELAERAGLVLKEKVWFEKSNYPGYHNKRGGGIQSNKKFPLNECYTFKFSLKHETSHELKPACNQTISTLSDDISDALNRMNLNWLFKCTLLNIIADPHGSKGTSWFDFPPSPFPGLSTIVDRKSDSAFTFNHISSHVDTARRQKALPDLERSYIGNSVSKTDKRKGDVNLERLEAGLATARALIREATSKFNHTALEDADYVPQGDIYRNAYAFHRSHLLMESLFKIYVYEEGEPPIFHNGPCKNIYSMEGLFLSFMETDTKFRTLDPDKAHVYFLPFSVVMIIEYLFHPIIRDKAVLERTVVDYVRVVSNKYPFWNRSLGADHVMLSCHDWGPRATWYVKQLYFVAIRVLCNANTSEHFNPKKDASFPEINLETGDITGLVGGLPPSERTTLAFFAGRMHGRIRPLLFQHWKEKDKDLLVYETLPEGVSYHDMLKKSKYCICPSGHEVASPRIAEAIYAECVPVLISQHYVLPFSDVLNWESFSIQVSVSEIPHLKEILMGISEEQYRRMQKRVKQVQRHFVVNSPPKRFDVFHMIIHSIWLRRLNVRIHG
ncbi:Exostosin family protein [Prunus dulcis]|uniref:Exostosin family protein n=1 Tax=Prunus dulcis TaxID=3755 RepID=A0A4Y1R709_PRUDU|nr:Exostosin family protein [Prunus dulcis]